MCIYVLVYVFLIDQIHSSFFPHFNFEIISYIFNFVIFVLFFLIIMKIISKEDGLLLNINCLILWEKCLIRFLVLIWITRGGFFHLLHSFSVFSRLCFLFPFLLFSTLRLNLLFPEMHIIYVCRKRRATIRFLKITSTHLLFAAVAA